MQIEHSVFSEDQWRKLKEMLLFQRPGDQHLQFSLFDPHPGGVAYWGDVRWQVVKVCLETCKQGLPSSSTTPAFSGSGSRH